MPTLTSAWPPSEQETGQTRAEAGTYGFSDFWENTPALTAGSWQLSRAEQATSRPGQLDQGMGLFIKVPPGLV